jgi:hypothetical protein
MIRISPETFVLAGQLGQLCRPPTPADGSRSWLRSQQLAYDGEGHLTFRASDFLVSVVSRFRVGGEDLPWDRRVSRAGLLHIARTASGGQYSLTAEPPRCVQIQKDHYESNLRRTCEYRYPLFRMDADSPFPGFTDPPTDAEWVPTELSTLRSALGFLAPTGAEADVQSRMCACAFLPEGRAVSWVEGVFLGTTAPPLVERIDLYRPVLRRLRQWLGYLPVGQEEQVRLAVAVPPHGVPTLLAATADGDHLFQTVAVPRPLPTETIERLDAEGPVVESAVPRQPLLDLCNLLRQVPGCKLVVAWHRGADGSWAMTVRGNDPVVSASVTVPVSVVRCVPADNVPQDFQISAESARIAIESFRCEHLLVRSRPSTGALILATADPNAEGTAPSPEKAYLRIGPRPAG